LERVRLLEVAGQSSGKEEHRQKKRDPSICTSLNQVLAHAYVESNSTKLEKQKLGSCMLSNYQSSQNARRLSSSDQPDWKSSMIHLKILWTLT